MSECPPCHGCGNHDGYLIHYEGCPLFSRMDPKELEAAVKGGLLKMVPRGEKRG